MVKSDTLAGILSESETSAARDHRGSRYLWIILPFWDFVSPKYAEGVKNDFILFGQVFGMDENIVGVENISIFGQTPWSVSEKPQTMLTGCPAIAVHVINRTDLPHCDFLYLLTRLNLLEKITTYLEKYSHSFQ